MLTTTLLAACSVLQVDAQEMRLLRFPGVHEDKLVFTYASDLWTSPSHGGLARRLTSHPNNEFRARFSADGESLAFTASYDGNDDIYVMPSEGGSPKRLTFDSLPELVVGWSPDGKIAYISRAGSNFGQLPRLWLIDPKGGMPEPTPVLEAADVSFSPDGSKVAYHRMPSNLFNWRHYRGGTQGRISIYDLKNHSYTELPSGRENSYTPMWVGNAIYYVSDREKNTINLYRYDLGSKQRKRLTDFTTGDIKWPSTDGKTIVFERDGYLYGFDIASEKLTRKSPRVLSEDVLARPMLKEAGRQVTWLALSPSGVRVAAEARGDIFSVPAKTGDTRNLTETPGARERFPIWSPDGKWIAYASDEGGTYQLYVRSQLGGAPTKLTTLPSTTFVNLDWSPDSKKIAFTTRDYGIHSVEVGSKTIQSFDKDLYGRIQAFDWSPDSRWIAYIKTGANLFGAVYMYDVANSKVNQITEGNFRDDTISFDKTGKYLYVVSGREVVGTTGEDLNVSAETLRQRVYLIVLSSKEPNPLVKPSEEEPEPAATATPEPTPAPAPPPAKPKTEEAAVVDLQDLGRRIVPLPMGPGSYPFVVGLKGGVLYFTGSGLSKFDLESKESSALFSGQITMASFNPNRTKMAYLGPSGLGIVDLKPGTKAGDGLVNVEDVELIVDPKQEWKQIFWEAWRFEKDNFYDVKMRGLDWQEIGNHYAEFLPYVSHRNDLTYVLGMMIAELGTSHTYTGGGDPGMALRPIPVGMLGADYEASNGRIRFARIYRGASFSESRRGPLGDPGVNVKAGDYLLAIDGKPVDANTNPNSLLINKVNRYVTLTVNSSPSLEGARKVRVLPVGSEQELRYGEWIEDNRKLVEKLSGGRIGYVHVPNTSEQGAIEFVKGYYSNVGKEALVVDERFNGGGYIPTAFVDVLARNYETFFRNRHGVDVGFPLRSMDGPKVMLINGYAGSGGDMFPYLFKRQGIGPLIGTRTWGGLVGINDFYEFSDGGYVTAPEAGFYEPRTGEWIAENRGVDPDMEVDARPDLIYKGEDPQLLAAVDYLLKRLKEKPLPKLKRPEVPSIDKG